MKIDKQKIKKIICVVLFFLLIGNVFLRCTYLFRNTSGVLRRNVVGFYAEEKNTLDVVFVGGSNVYRYWDCMQAWNDYGFTSYNYGASAMAAGTTLAGIKEVEKTQNPELIVVDVRKFLSRYLDTEFNEGVRNPFDAQDFNLNRLLQIEYFRRVNGISIGDTIDKYVDLLEYHGNYGALAKKLNWQLIDNRPNESMDSDGYYKGFAIVDWHTFLEEPTVEYTSETTRLNPIAEKYFVDVMEYCQKKELALLWVCAPFSLNETDMKELNEMERLAKEYNADFLDTNRHYTEMGVDFSTDFYDKKHMSLLGAEKYTDYLARYMVDTYQLPDHRTQKEYVKWNEIYQEYIVTKEEKKQRAQERINEGQWLLDVEEMMRQTDSVFEWMQLSNNEDLVVFTIIQNRINDDMAYTEEQLMSEFGVNNSVIRANTFIGVYNEEILSEECNVAEVNGRVSYTPNSQPYEVSLADNVIEVDDEKFSITYSDGIQMYVYDKNFHRIVDKVMLSILEDGRLSLEHME